MKIFRLLLVIVLVLMQGYNERSFAAQKPKESKPVESLPPRHLPAPASPAPTGAPASKSPRVESVAPRPSLSQPAAQPYRSPLYETMEEIKTVRPEVSYEVLFQDGRAIEATLPAIRYLFNQRGFSYDDAEQATLAGWRQLRDKQLEPTALLSPKELMVYVSEYGKIVIKSVPDAADVELNDKKLSEPTTAKVWTKPGVYHVRISKYGFESVEEVCEIREGKKTEIQITLPPVVKKQLF